MTTPIAARIGGLIKRAGAFLESKGFSGLMKQSNAVAAYRGVSIGNIRISVDALFTVWRNHGDVYACIRDLSQNVGSNGYKWENVNDPDSDANPKDYAEAERIFAASGGLESIKRRMIRDVHISGNAYFHIQKSVGKTIMKLVPIDARTMRVVCKEDGTVVKWIQQVGMKSVTFEPEDIYHFKIEDDPNSPVYGLPPLETIIWEVRTDLAALISNYEFFENSARPDTQYILDESVNEDAQDEIIKQIQENLKGVENSHKALAIKGVKDVKILTVSPRDMEYNLLRRFTTEKVCAALGVPKSIINYTDGVNYSNGENQTRKYWEGTIAPLNGMAERSLTADLAPRLGVTASKIKFNDRRFDTEESVREDVKLGLITINEARQKRGMEYYDAAEMGEFVDKPIIYNGASALPVLDVGQNPEPAADEPAANEEKPDTNKAFKLVKDLAQRYLYGRSQP
jgi:HK97 family phage portal protein